MFTIIGGLYVYFALTSQFGLIGWMEWLRA